MKYTMKQILSSYTKEKRQQSSLWARVFSRPLSFPLTYIFINMGISANTMSVISMVEVIIACVLIMLGGKLLPWGIALYVLWHVLDCCDGNIARVKKQSSYFGDFFDAVSGYIAPAFIFLSVGVAAYNTTAVDATYKHWFIVFGGMASIADILGRLIYQKYLVIEYRLGLIEDKGNIDETRANGIIHVIDVVMRTMTYSCLFMPLLIISAFFNNYDILITAFGLYNVCFALASAAYFVRRAATLQARVALKNTQNGRK